MKKRNMPIVYIAAVLISLFAIAPFVWMILTSLKPQAEIYSKPLQYLPQHLNAEGYKGMLNAKADPNVNFISWFKNTAIVSLLTTALSLIVSALGGYAMSRFQFRGRMSIGYIILLTQMLPGSLLIIPLYLIMKDYHLLNSYFGLVIAYSTIAVPFCTWMLKGYFDSVATAIDEAASIDGAGRWTTFVRVILPLTLPGLVVTAVFSFLTSWNEFMFAQTFLSDYDKWTLSVGIASFQGQYVVNWDYLMAGSVMTTLPIVIAFWLLQKHLVSGMTAGAVK
ncbi:carbohydrate ABC transporter permease [Cohnella rhizosphaerae]|uniref:Carbohydrate ABC transporter permease n=1 Tax=Cohnella rhizosphaerae TaxID=1457232 RepID=A0A9X4KTZ1_9BACL|nr:carbohydrate ABC transporter permease [Cohnella rhizosphaerae]MDG0810211.1 carbohydrate ABC transporter permease [Cohnella rhizosphaerae]